MTDGVADDYYPNNPQLLRLYTDLLLNGVIDFPHKEENAASETELKAPEPVAYPWVNDSSVSYSLQYSKNVMKETGDTLEALWDSRFGEVMRRSSLDSFGVDNGKTKSERLSVWLDNYVERGSFDDRTLLIINTSER